ncbi:MAG TPA: hypothetical protein VN213_00080 [Solirubrobacteraceae bacterium]|nr:hypothetical protein [Solirubrobacteraceae bacterium]
MSFLLLGLDSLIAGVAVCAIVGPRSRLQYAALFGIADATVFLIGAGLGWQLAGALTEALELGILLALGVYLLVVAAGMTRVTARWPLWVLPWALTMDNLAYGVGGEHSGSLLGSAAEQGVSSALMALAGLMVAVVLPRAVPALQQRATAMRFAGAALLVVAGGFALVG